MNKGFVEVDFKVKLSKRDFREFRCGVLRANRLRFTLSLCIQLCLWLWLLIPFFQLWGMGLEVGVPFGKVVQTYPLFMMERGYLPPTFFALFAMFLCCTPTALSLLTFKKAYHNASYLGQDTVVFSQWRFCIYDEQKNLLCAMPYTMIDKVLWLRHSIAVLLRSGDAVSVSTREVDEDVQEALLELLNDRMKLRLEMVSEPAPMMFSQERLWQAEIDLHRSHFCAASRLLVLQQRPVGIRALLVLAVVLLINLLLDGTLALSILLTLLCVVTALSLLPCVAVRRADRIARKHPWVLQVLSGETVIAQQGFFRQNQLYRSYFPWHTLSYATVGDSGILVVSRNRIASFIPVEYFADSQEMVRFADWLNLKIQKKKADVT